MMTLKEVAQWLETQVTADVWKIGTYDNSNQKTICIRNLTSSRGKLSVGGLSNTHTAVKGISIVVHWNKNPDETERVAQSIHALFYACNPVISGYQTVICDMRSDEPIFVGTDDNGIYEYVIETWITYMREKEE